MARQSRRIHEENHDRWLISYADFITLLFALFVVLYAMSKVDEGKYKVLGNSLNFAFGSLSVGKAGADPALSAASEQELLLKSLVDKRNARMAEQLRKQNEAMQTLVKNLNQVMAPLVKSELVNVTQTPRGVVVEINASALFEQGEAELQRNAARTLSAVAEVLEPGTQAIEVEGHTDDIPIRNFLPTGSCRQRAPAAWCACLSMRGLLRNACALWAWHPIGLSAAMTRLKGARAIVALPSPYLPCLLMQLCQAG
jgi:chemotaxis protein MotB